MTSPNREDKKKEDRSLMETQPLEALNDELLEAQSLLPGQKPVDRSAMETQPLEALEDELASVQLPQTVQVQLTLTEEQRRFVEGLVQRGGELTFDGVVRAALELAKDLLSEPQNFASEDELLAYLRRKVGR